jgi:transcriptional regulator
MTKPEEIASETVLSEQQARVVVLRQEGLTWADIGEKMNISRGTAQGYYERAEEKYENAERTVTLLKEIGFEGR